MSLARAFTTHRRKHSSSEASQPQSQPLRAFSMRSSAKGVDRNKISAPVALISTTNTLAYNAPDISSLKKQTRNVSDSSTTSSASHGSNSSDESDARSTSTRSVRSRETLTDASSVDSSPTSPQPNHLSEYFKSSGSTTGAGPRRSVSSSNLQRASSRQTQASLNTETPSIPERAASHSKRAHERLAHQRSLQNVRSHGSIGSIGSIASIGSNPALPSMAPREQRSSLEMFNRTAVEPNHPFGKELEKLSEVAEEFGDALRSAEWEEDLMIMKKKGLKRFCADDYMFEIRPLFAAAFPTPIAAGGAWI